MIQFDFDKDCYGCGLCAQECPVGAIKMMQNREGFAMPVVDSSICVNCGKCDKACIRTSKHDGIDIGQSKIYAYYLKNGSQRKKSTSGGAFYALANATIESGGIVCGCVWNDKMEAEIVATDTLEGIERMRGSKYVESSIRCYDEIKQALKKKRRVLFSGLPCQVAAVQKLFGQNENLTTAALLCEGTASTLAWQKYKVELENRVNSNMVNAIHRQTGKYGWIAPIAEYEFANGKKIHTLSFTLDEYVHNMIYGFFTRNSCYHCGFKANDSTADLMIGDFWGLPKELMRASRNLGCSVVLVNSEKGKALLEKTFNGAEYREVDLETVSKRNPPLLNSAGKNGYRDQILTELQTRNFHDVVNQYCGMNTTKVKIQRLLHKFGLAGIAKRILRG